jgi:biopolymer transport protein ExbD
MGMSVGGSEEGTAMAEINTTPLVDVMLVLLIIFLITIPVITKSVKIEYAKAVNIPTETKPENINITIDERGNVYWNESRVPTADALLEKIKSETMGAQRDGRPQPEFHLRADKNVRYEFVGRTIVLAQRAGVSKLGFITEPDRGVRGTRRP